MSRRAGPGSLTAWQLVAVLVGTGCALGAGLAVYRRVQRGVTDAPLVAARFSTAADPDDVAADWCAPGFEPIRGALASRLAPRSQRRRSSSICTGATRETRRPKRSTDSVVSPRARPRSASPFSRCGVASGRARRRSSRPGIAGRATRTTLTRGPPSSAAGRPPSRPRRSARDRAGVPARLLERRLLLRPHRVARLARCRRGRRGSRRTGRAGAPAPRHAAALAPVGRRRRRTGRDDPFR